MYTREERLYRLLEPAIEVFGLELLGVQLLAQGQHSKLRVYIDSEGGITVDDCARVSHQVSGVLDVEDPIAGQYTLEVSSPGLDRPLFRAAHYERHKGSRISIKLQAPLDGRRSFKGELLGMQTSNVWLVEDDVEWLIPLALIGTARLIPEIER